MQRSFPSWRRGFSRLEASTVVPWAEPDMAAAIDDAAERFAALGAVVEEVELGPLSDYAGVNRVILTSEAYAVHEQWLKQRPGDYAHFTRERLLPGAFMRAADYIQALRHRERMKNAYAELMRDYDVLLTASSMQTACAIDDVEAIEHTYARQARTPFNVVGGPALVVPAGFAQDGLPLSIQLAGRAFDEATVYRVGHAFEQATEWRHRHPPVD